MPYVVSHEVSLAGKAYSIGMPVSDAVGDMILAEHPNGCVRVMHDDDLCVMHDDSCAHESHDWNAAKAAPASDAPTPSWMVKKDTPAEA